MCESKESAAQYSTANPNINSWVKLALKQKTTIHGMRYQNRYRQVQKYLKQRFPFFKILKTALPLFQNGAKTS